MKDMIFRHTCHATTAARRCVIEHHGHRLPLCDEAVMQNSNDVSDPWSVRASMGFTMMPGIFFGTIVILCGRFFAWTDATARAIWYATGFALNLFIAWKVGVIYESMRRTG